MKKGFLIITLSLLMGLGFTACNNAPLTGTWVEPADESSVFGEYGLKLNKDGSVEPINMGYREYNSWEKVDDLLILKGKYTKDRLVLKDFGNNTVTYQRKND